MRAFREIHLRGDQRKTEPSLFEVTLLLDGVRFQYGFQASDECFLEEWLYAWPHGKKQVWFERDNNTFKFGESLKGENKLIEDVTRPNALFLSAAVQHKHPQLDPIFLWFRSSRPINLPERPDPSFPLKLFNELALARLLDEDVGQQILFPKEELSEPLEERFRNLLKKADIGILDLRSRDRIDWTTNAVVLASKFLAKTPKRIGRCVVAAEGRISGHANLVSDRVAPLADHSGRGHSLVDELERSLHPTLAQQIIRQFNDPVANPRNAQLIFATHDTNLLGNTLAEPALRRDQVWLTEKDGDGATVLYPLTDYKPRKAENLERGYLQGRYGAIPFLGDFLVAPE